LSAKQIYEAKDISVKVRIPQGLTLRVHNFIIIIIYGNKYKYMCRGPWGTGFFLYFGSSNFLVIPKTVNGATYFTIPIGNIKGHFFILRGV
jgi:hypothetical protein